MYTWLKKTRQSVIADEDLMMPVQREVRSVELTGQTQTRTHHISV